MKEYFETELDPGVAELVQRAISELGEDGRGDRRGVLPLYQYAQPISNAILSAEATAAHRDVLLSDGDKLYPQVRDRLEEGLFITAAEYLRAQQARQVFCAQVDDLLKDVTYSPGRWNR